MDFDSIFHHAVSISDAAERGRYLNDACGGDSALRRQIDTRLKTHQRESTDETLISDSHHGDLNPDNNDSKEFELTLIGTTNPRHESGTALVNHAWSAGSILNWNPLQHGS